MPITPDTKNWTWVLERPCDECGYDARTVDRTEVAHLTRTNAARWPDVLAGRGAHERPDASTWSPLEYGAHVRDVLRLYRQRLALMVESDDPLYPNWDQDATAVAEQYGEQDPATVGAELVEAADRLATAFEELPASAWSRPGRRGDGVAFTIETFALYFIHDPVHHLWDVSGRRFAEQ